MTEVRFHPFARVDSAGGRVIVRANVAVGEGVAVTEGGRRAPVGKAMRFGDDLAIEVTSSSVWEKIRQGIITGAELTTYAISKGSALVAAVLVDRAEKGSKLMFAKRAFPLPMRPEPAPPYLIIKALREAREAQFSRRSPAAKAATAPAGAGAVIAINQALAHPSVSPRLQARVIASRMRPGPGAPPPDVDSIRAEIQEQHATGQLPDDVAAALLLALDPPEPPSFASSAVDYDAILGTPRVDYDPTKPWKAKAASSDIWGRLDAALRLKKAAQALRRVA
jgi:hypothetical protein